MITKRFFGTTKNGEAVHAYTLENDRGIAVTVLDYGATLQSVVLTHKGERIDVLLGYDTIEEYEQNDGYLGASIGRFAGRIPDAELRIGSDVFPVTANEGKNQLHGGKVGFDKRIWTVEQIHSDSEKIRGDFISFALRSRDGDEGYPGDAEFHVQYGLYGLIGRMLGIAYSAASDRVTAWNPTNHAYWNLNGHDAGDARGHLLEIPADRYVPVDGACIPLGTEADVAGTRFDFRKLRKIADAYDHSFVLNGHVLQLFGSRGIGMQVRTDCKAVQLYTAEYLTERKGKGGAIYRPFGAVCLETEGRQTMPDRPVAPENILPGKGQSVHTTTHYRFIYEED